MSSSPGLPLTSLDSTSPGLRGVVEEDPLPRGPYLPGEASPAQGVLGSPSAFRCPAGRRPNGHPPHDREMLNKNKTNFPKASAPRQTAVAKALKINKVPPGRPEIVVAYNKLYLT